MTIIHDAKHVEREERLIKQLNSQNITEWDYSPAVYDNNPINGVAMAHKLAIENSFENNGYGFIAEDDIRFTSSRSMSYYLEMYNSLPSDWDIYLMGYYNFKAIPVNTPSGLIRLRYFTGMHGYMVSDKMRIKLRETKTKGHIDVGMTGNVIYAVHPVVALQDLTMPSIRMGKVLTKYDRLESKLKTLK